MQLKCTLIYILFSIISIVVSSKQSKCIQKNYCGTCIQEPGCVWCSKPRISGKETPIYCNDILDAPSNWCEKDFLVKEDSIFTTSKDSPLSQSGSKIVQIRPQNVKLKIRRGSEYKINFQYQQAKNYPIDLYFLMDLSASMDQYRYDLGNLGGQLAEEMKKLTSNFRLGFGSFVDKRDLPFINTSPSLLKNPCGKPETSCEPAYSFKNHLSLTSEDALFIKQVKMAKKSGNVDSPEGGFDALMQAMVCNDTIGWRIDARRLIVFATDADFHIAGDGKLGGVIEPNDAKCHMTNNEYTHDLVYDYPSVSQINYVANENNFNIILAIVSAKGDKRIYGVYETLSKHIDNSGIGPFGRNTGENNIVNLITENYNKIVGKITITDNSSSDIHITYKPDCTSSGSTTAGDRSICNNVQLNQVINFTATVRVDSCLNATQVVMIKPGGLIASLHVELDVVCECECERSTHSDYEVYSSDCEKQGDKQCGVCRCHEGRYGDHCQCSGFGDSAGQSDESRCMANGTLCSGLGDCRCGQCVCRGNKYGTHCQCDDTVCSWYAGKICSGLGRCDCGKCVCNEGWTGATCNVCKERNATCIAPGDEGEGTAGARLCSGRGECACGQCKCDASKNSGDWCEEMLDTPAEICQKLQTCLECLDTSPNVECESTSCSNLILNNILQPILENNDYIEDGFSSQICRYKNCTHVLTYAYVSKYKYNLTEIEKIECSDPMTVIGFLLLYVIGSILLAGIVALIIWKAYTTVFDRKEYARFENEKKKSKWHTDENPLFINPINNFTNPTYNRRSIWKNSSR